MLLCLTLLLLTNIINAADYDSYRFIGTAPNCTLQGCHQKSAGYDSFFHNDDFFCNDDIKCDNISIYPYPNITFIMGACPLLSYLATQYRSSTFIWNKNCSCPRWSCHPHNNTKSVYNQFINLEFNWYPLQTICTNCTCELWTDSYKYSQNNTNNVYAWNCKKYQSSEPLITDSISNETFQCDHDKTNVPSPFPTIPPTPSPQGRRLLNQLPTPSPVANEWIPWQCYDSQTSSSEICQLYAMCTFSKLTITNTAKDICIEEDDIGPEINGIYECYTAYTEWRDEYVSQCPGCFKSVFSFPVYKYDCINDVLINETYTAEYIFFCCNDEWNCNNKTIEELEDNCTVLSEPPKYIKYKTECDYSLKNINNLYDITSDRNFIRAALCGNSLNYDEYKSDNQSLCDLMKVYEKYYTFCSCNLYRIQAANVINNYYTDPSWMIPQEYHGDILLNTYIVAKYTLLKNQYKTGFKDGNYWKLHAPYWECDVSDDYFVCNVTQQYEKLNNNDHIETTETSRDYEDCDVMNILTINFNVIYIGILIMLIMI